MGKKRKRAKRFRRALRELSVVAFGAVAEYLLEQVRVRKPSDPPPPEADA